MSTTCFGCKTLPTLSHSAAVPPSLEPIVFVGRMSSGVGQFQAAYECVCCGRRWLECAPSTEMLPRFRLALAPAPAPKPIPADVLTSLLAPESAGEIKPASSMVIPLAPGARLRSRA